MLPTILLLQDGMQAYRHHGQGLYRRWQTAAVQNHSAMPHHVAIASLLDWTRHIHIQLRNINSFKTKGSPLTYTGKYAENMGLEDTPGWSVAVQAISSCNAGRQYIRVLMGVWPMPVLVICTGSFIAGTFRAWVKHAMQPSHVVSRNHC